MSRRLSQEAVDRGLQPERTALSWRRTSTSLAAFGVLVAKVMPAPPPVRAVVSITLLALAAAIGWLAGRRYRVTAAVRESGRDAEERLLDGALLAGSAIAVVAGGASMLGVLACGALS